MFVCVNVRVRVRVRVCVLVLVFVFVFVFWEREGHPIGSGTRSYKDLNLKKKTSE